MARCDIVKGNIRRATWAVRIYISTLLHYSRPLPFPVSSPQRQHTQGHGEKSWQSIEQPQSRRSVVHSWWRRRRCLSRMPMRLLSGMLLSTGHHAPVPGDVSQVRIPLNEKLTAILSSSHAVAMNPVDTAVYKLGVVSAHISFVGLAVPSINLSRSSTPSPQ